MGWSRVDVGPLLRGSAIVRRTSDQGEFVSDASTGPDQSAAKHADAPPSERRRRRPSGEKMKAGAKSIRSTIASVVWLIAVVCALFLAVGALLIALKANQENSVVAFVLSGAELLEGPFGREGGVFEFTDENAEVKNALVNWGIAAVVYLVIGKILDRIIRP